MENKSKFVQYAPIVSIIFTAVVFVVTTTVTTTWSISSLHTVNMVQDERLARLEQNESKYEDRFDKLDTKIDAGFSNIVQLILNQKKDKQ